jgi:hypothetical protein
MNDNQYNNDVTPDDLLSDFRGKGIFPILVFTVFVHTVVLLGSSVPWMMETFLGSVDKDATEEERMKGAVQEATGSLRDIAEKYGLHPEELSSQFTRKEKPSPATAKVQDNGDAPSDGTPDQSAPSTDPEEPKSAIEKELEVKATGPALPAIPKEEEEDLFK